MVIIIIALIEMILFRYHYIYNADKEILYLIGVSLMQTFMVVVFLYVSSIWMSHLMLLKNKLMNKVIYLSVSIFPVALVNFYKINNYISDNVILFILILYVSVFMVLGDVIFNSFFKFINLNTDEVEKAFLEYPPKSYFDLMLYMLVILIVSVIPFFSSLIWSK